jgi:prepilin-type N-terminal cleavage/methylation domain-containing protein
MQPRRRGTNITAHRRNAGFSLLELLVSIGLIAVFAGLLLERMLYYEEAAEKAVVEWEATTLKVALQVRIGDLIARNQKLDYTAIARENPMRWLDKPLVGYRGEFGGDPSAELPKGSWYYDRSAAELVYIVKLDRNFRPVSDGPTRVRWHVKLVRPDGAIGKDGTVIGLQFVPVVPYRWF